MVKYLVLLMLYTPIHAQNRQTDTISDPIKLQPFEITFRNSILSMEECPFEGANDSRVISDLTLDRFGKIVDWKITRIENDRVFSKAEYQKVVPYFEKKLKTAIIKKNGSQPPVKQTYVRVMFRIRCEKNS